MFNIRQFLQRASNRQTKSHFLRLNVQDTIKKYLNLDIPLEDISTKGQKIIIKNLSQSARSSLYIKKSSILEDINKNSDYEFFDIT